MSTSKKFSDALLKLVSRLNTFNYKDACRIHNCVSFIVDGNTIGVVAPHVLKQLNNYPDVFKIVPSEPDQYGQVNESVHLNESLATVEDRDKAFAQVLSELRDKDVFVTLRGWRDETFSIYYRRDVKPIMNVERAACCLFGFLQYGVHINGYTFKDGNLMMWIGRRSKTKQTYPNMLDNMCAGGLGSGLGLRECAIKECQEEASVDDQTLTNLKPVGCVSYCFSDERGIHPETEYLFDLELSPDFVPRNADGEMENFHLFTLQEIQDQIIAEQFKPNCALIIVDFLMRHGLLTHDEEPNYTYLVERMHMTLQPGV